MGSVWRAKQSEPVKRFVAVKLVKAGIDSRQVLARFEAERQALVLMDHPNLSKVLDGGLHGGRPFFVMELVKGVPITAYCDDRKLTPKERLELFVPVCQAIQHAHQKGIIHRDIKPSNPEELFKAAGAFADLMPLIADEKHHEAVADACLSALKLALQQGYSKIQPLWSEPRFAALRVREDFKKLLAELQAKSERE